MKLHEMKKSTSLPLISKKFKILSEEGKKELPDNIDKNESRLLGITALWEKDKIEQVVKNPKEIQEGKVLISIIYRNLNDGIKNNIQSIIEEKNLSIQPIKNQDE